MSIITWIVVVFVSLFFWAFAGVSTEEVSTPIQYAATPAELLQPDTGPLILETGHAERLGKTQPDATRAYAATASTLYRTDESGAWTDVGDAPPSGDIVVGDNPDVLMTGDEEQCYQGGGGAAVQISIDGGISWTRSTDDRAIRPLAIWADDAFAIGAWCGGVLLSNDLGATWESPPNDATLGFDVTAFAIVANTEREVLFSLTGEGGTSTVYHVDLNSATAWENLEPIFTYWALGGLAGTGETFAVASITGVSLSTDAGATWETDRAGLEGYTLEVDPATDGLPEGVDPAGKGLRSILIDEDGRPFAVGGESDVFTKDDSGRWEHAIGFGEPATWLTPSPDNGFILIQAETGVWSTGRGN